MSSFVIKVGINKKIGQPNFGSFGAECAFDVTCDLGILADNDRLTNTIREAYRKCLESVNEQIHSQSHGQQVPQQPSVHVQDKVSPMPKAKSQFGSWLKAKADSYGLPLPMLTSAVYKCFNPEGTAQDYIAQGKEMAAYWDSHAGGSEDMFRYFDEKLDSCLSELEPKN